MGIMSHQFEMFIGVVITSNFVVLAFETDVRARKDKRQFAKTTLDVVTVVNTLFLIAYSCECAARIFVMHWDYFRYMWNNFDFVVIIAGMVTEIFSAVVKDDSETEQVPGVQVLR